MKMRRGQVVLFLLVVLVALLTLVLLNVDVFIATRSKGRVENGGDAAALAAARRQGSLINEVANLNIEHIKAALSTNQELCAEIEITQRRKVLLGPLEALTLADKAAQKNNMPIVESYSKILREHIDEISSVYMGQSDYGDPYPEPYPGAWQEYAAAIQSAIHGGLHVGVDNIEFFHEAPWGHLLLNSQFYNAIAGRNWCWFHFHAMGTLENYGSFRDWAPLPVTDSDTLDNSEIFSLHLRSWRGALTEIFSEDELDKLIARYVGGAYKHEDIDYSKTLLADPEQVWFFFDDDYWGRWFNGRHLIAEDINDFPLLGQVKEVYNVRGAASITRCSIKANPVMGDSKFSYTWSAAAKPFGTIDSLDDERDVVTAVKSFVLPCMTDARLVPIDSVGGAFLATADIDWVHHIRKHLALYLEYGPYAVSGCWYCDQLRTWEISSFRRIGLTWLKYNSHTCVRGGNSSSGHGGTSHGH